MSILFWIIVGLLAGALAKLVIILGILGALIGGFTTQSILGLGSGGPIWSVLVATLEAIIILAIYRMAVAAPKCKILRNFWQPWILRKNWFSATGGAYNTPRLHRNNFTVFLRDFRFTDCSV